MSKTNKKKTTKAVTDASWSGGSNGVSSAFSVQSLRAIDKTLSPQDAYALSIDLRAAIHARAEPMSQGKIRFFHRRSGEEIVSGDLINFFSNPSPGVSTSAFLYELSSWWDLAGEVACGSIQTTDGLVGGIYALSPFRLAVHAPNPARHISAVKQWRYSFEDGVQIVYGAESVILMKSFNPNSSVRGLPPVLAGVNEISSAYESIAYNRRFFSNNAEPSHIVQLKDVTDPKLLDQFRQEYEANHSIRGGNSHKVMVVGGSDVEIKNVSETVKDAAFVGLQGLTTERIFRLYKVLPIHSGATPTPGYSVEEQNKVFAETVLMGQAERLSQYLQLLVDRFFRSASTGDRGAKSLSKAMKARVEKARAERVDSDVVVVLDIDHLPIVSALKQQKLAYAKDLQATFKITPLEAAEEVGFEIDENEANKRVWVLSTEVGVDPDEPAPQPAADQPPVEPPQPGNTTTGEGDEPSDDSQKAARNVVMALRKLALDKLDEGRVFRLSEADALNEMKSDRFKSQIRADYLAVKGIIEKGGDKDDIRQAIKKHFNQTYDRKFLRGL